MVLPRYHERDDGPRFTPQPPQGNIHAVGEGLSRSCNIRLPRYLPFSGFPFCPVPFAAEPLLSAATHFAKATAMNRDKSEVKQCGFRSYIFGRRNSDSLLLYVC